MSKKEPRKASPWDILASLDRIEKGQKDMMALLKHQDVFTDANAREIFRKLSAHVEKLKGTGITQGEQSDALERRTKNMAVPTIQEYRDLLAEADTETNRIAGRIADLIAQIVPGLSEADANEVKAGLQAEVAKLQGVGVVPTP